MAKGKKASGKKYISNGERHNVSRNTTNAVRREYMQSGERLMNQLMAHRSKKRTVVTIENPNKNETNKRFIRVSGDTYFKPDEPFQM